MKTEIRVTLACVFFALASCGGQDPAPSPSPPPVADAAVAPTETAPATPAAAAEDARLSAAMMKPCTQCKWSTFKNKVVPVERVECTDSDGNSYQHCHLVTPKAGLTREIQVMQDATSEGFSFKLETRGNNQADRMECENLVPDVNNPRVIEGTCKIVNAEHGPGVHHFRAYIAPREDGSVLPDGTPWPEVVFEFRHKPFAMNGEGDPVHNGEGHAHLPGG